MDMFVKLPDSEVKETCSIDRKKCMIELAFGEKIAVDEVTWEVGGNAGNNAVGISRLGKKSAVIATLGTGFLDDMVIDKLKTEDVETKYVMRKGQDFGMGVVINYQEERTILSHYPDIECAFPRDDSLEADWVYLTSVGAKFDNFYREAVDWAVNHKTKIAYNPSTRQIKAGSRLRYVLPQTKVLFVNREEGQKLILNILAKEIDVMQTDSLLKELYDLGPETVILTDGPAGTHAFDGQKIYFQDIIDAPVIERTGAGDAFAAGFLAALMYEKNLEEALLWGTKNSASVLGYIGPQKGLLKYDSIT
jgi:sugar/nucleoside kinase (ribokinase family)